MRLQMTKLLNSGGYSSIVHIDGVGAVIFLLSPNKDKLHYVLKLHFPTSYNVAEYEACLHDMRLAVELGLKRLYIYGDLALVINQLNKEWDTTHEKMDSYCKEIRKVEGKFYDIEYIHAVQDKNQATDAVLKLGSSRAESPHGVLVQDLVKPSIEEEMMSMDEKPQDKSQAIGAYLSSDISLTVLVSQTKQRTSVSYTIASTTYWSVAG